MDSPFLGLIQPFAFNFPPKGWAQCNGQILSIQSNQALFALLGTYYGGNGSTSFALPDLRCRLPIHFGQSAFGNYVIGQLGGSPSATLNLSQLPPHSHGLLGTTTMTLNVGVGAVAQNAGSGTPANGNTVGINGTTSSGSFVPCNTFASATPNVQLSGGATVSSLQVSGTSVAAGGNSSFPTLAPYLGVNYCIATSGIYPSRN